MNERHTPSLVRSASITYAFIQAAVLVGLLAGRAHGQCQRWGSDFYNDHPGCSVYALGVFDFGSGSQLYAGGCAPTVIRWDGSSWHGVESFNGDVQAFQVFDDGSGPALYIGGGFTAFGLNGGPAYGIARWDGVTCSALAPGLVGGFGGRNANVKALTVFDDGTGPALYAGGYLPDSNGVALHGVAKWTGSQWVPLGTGLFGYVEAFAQFDDGSGPALFVGGYFTSAGGQPASGLAKWDGTAWTPIGLGVVSAVYALQVWDDGSGPALYLATADVTLPGGGSSFGVAKWDGTAWSALGGGTSSLARSLAVYDDGTGNALYVGGHFTQAGGITVNRIARWNGSQWSALGAGVDASPVDTMLVKDDGVGSSPALYIGGGFNFAADLLSPHLARWIPCEGPVDSFCPGDGTFAWCPCRRYQNGPVNDGAPGHGCDNSLLAGGALLTANGSPAPDSIVLTATGELPTALTIFLQGNQLLSAGAPFGDGLRCVGGSLKRLYKKSAASGTISAPQSGDLSVTARSAALGDPIASGSLRYYQTYYRDPNPNTPYCVLPAGSTFNSSNGIRIVW